jgi:hypothetical protein
MKMISSDMARYVKRFSRIGHALGPSEERGFALWAGYELVDVDDDLSSAGLLRVDDLPEGELERLGVVAFARVEPDDAATYAKLGVVR